MLVALQRIDDSLRELREMKAELEKLRADNVQSLEVFDEMLSAQEERLGEARGFISEKQEEIREAEQNIARSRQRLSSITSQRELTALNKELEQARRKVQSRNEELQKLQAELDGAVADYEEKKSGRASLGDEMKALEVDLESRIQEREASLSKLNDSRDETRKAMPRDVYGKYSRIAKGREGVAVIVIREPSCHGCNMAVPPQQFIRLQRFETLEQCSNCSRFLVLEDEGVPAPA
jgi:predicted  nucleic acid-binding Zn-ribbon protein